MGFQVHQSHRLEDLLAALARHLAEDPLPPLQSETILVPAQGLARWVQCRLAECHGIAAGIRLPFLGAFLQDLARAAAAGRGGDPFAREVVVWRLWRLLDDPDLREDLGPAAAYCGDDPTGEKRYQLCARLAACLDDYQLYRDDVLLAWSRGDDQKQLGPHAAWQGRLWRALLRDAGVDLPAAAARARRSRRPEPPSAWLFPELADGLAPPPGSPVGGPAHRLEQLRHLLRDADRARAALPPRLSVFGAGTLPPAFAKLLQQVAAHVPVRLYVPSPTRHFFGDLHASGREGGNGLLARFGAESREFADLLLDLEGESADGPPLEPGDTDEAAAGPGGPTTLLRCLQQDVLDVVDRGGPGGPPRLPIAVGDDSLRVHDCHSPQRELEVVRDQILAAFADDATLQPHDVLVLVPDVDRYAAYAEAVFGPVRDHLPFHVADRNPASELPICSTILAMLQLAQGRLLAPDVLHLLEEPALRRRFRIAASDLPVLQHLCRRAGIRWGLDGPTRAARFGLPPFDDNAWLPGLDRMLLGTATGPVGDLVGGVLPAADVTESRNELLACLVDFARTLFARLDPLAAAHPLAQWADHVDALARDLFVPEGGDDELALTHLRQATVELRALAATARHATAVAPTVLRDWLLAALQRSTGARGFLAGAVTVAAMLPMRTVPARCLFVCGLDDASFPRRDQPAPFDLAAAARRAGDRSRRLDDRQMFLDVLMAARDRLHLTFVGHSAKDDSECAPSVVLAELFEHVDRSCAAPPGFPRARDVVHVRHPLQPWSPRYRNGQDPRLFTFGRQGGGPPLPTGDEEPWCPAKPAAAAAPAIPSAPDLEPIPLAHLLDFWHHPCRFFLDQTMRLRLPRDDDRDDESEPFTLHNLDKYHLQDEALRRALRGEAPPRRPFELARASGILPVGSHGQAAFAEVAAETESFLRSALAHHATGRRLLRIRGRDYSIVGEVDGLGAEEMVRIRAAKLKTKDRLRAWLLHLVVAAARGQGEAGLPARTRVIGSDKHSVAAELAPEEALGALDQLVDLYRRGQREPLLFFERSSEAYATARCNHEDEDEARRAARKCWEPANPDSWPKGDREDPHVELCMRGRDPLGEAGFAAAALAVWAPLLTHMTPEAP